MTPRTPIWMAIVRDLSDEIARGVFAPGDKLPTEQALAARFGVNRHTVRRALGQMAEDGLVYARRGAGVFVMSAPTEYPIGRRVRFHQNLTAAGRTPAKTVLRLDTRPALEDECDALELAKAAMVHFYEGISYADGQPIALFHSVFPAARFPTLPDDIARNPSVTHALAQAGVTDYTRQRTSVTATVASATQALHLRIAEHAPVLRTVGVNVDPDQRPIEFGRTWFAGDRVTLTLGDT